MGFEMQVIEFRDYSGARFFFRLYQGRKSLREIVREISIERREREAILRKYPSLALWAGREDLVSEADKNEQCS